MAGPQMTKNGYERGRPSCRVVIEQELDGLRSMTLAGLRLCWSKRWGVPPRLRSVALLRYMIAWRLQAELFGGLDDETQHLLKQTSIPRPRLPTGTRLTREYRGVLHDVEVHERSFRYAGQDYSSLSKVAGAITGTHGNGPRFFGLRDGGVAP